MELWKSYKIILVLEAGLYKQKKSSMEFEKLDDNGVISLLCFPLFFVFV